VLFFPETPKQLSRTPSTACERDEKFNLQLTLIAARALIETRSGETP